VLQGTNHVGHALLVKLLTPLFEKTAERFGDARLVWNTSLGYQLHKKIGVDLDKVRTPQHDISPIGGTWMRYGQSKFANLIYARAYAAHHPSVTSVSIHPGTAATGLVSSLSLGQRIFIYLTNIGRMITPEQCAWNQQWAATAPKGTGEPVGIKVVPSGQATNDELATKLWDWTQKELESYQL
jgi:NAD(P)-dependent dehydrogenase (short-subunit alcohol dehydrogenase family)